MLATFKSGKSAGTDGVTYELLKILAQTGARRLLMRTFNALLSRDQPLPDAWFVARVVLLPKIREPSQPKHLRPIVLSPVDYKLFTKILLFRLRRVLPPVGQGGQILGIQGGQVMDGVTAAKHAVHLANQWSQPLVVAKLDVSQAFDTISHLALARYLQEAAPCVEAELLLKLIVHARVELNFAEVTWQQPLSQGIFQGSPYGAEIFARVLDHYLKPLVQQWARNERTWLCDSMGATPLHNIAYADDVLLFATSVEQLNRMLQGLSSTLQAIGLHLSVDKSQYIRSSLVEDKPVALGQGEPLTEVASFLFLGVLLGFRVTCQATISVRLAAATNAFFGYLTFLTACSAPLVKRLHLLSAFVTSRWRWMAAAVRPTTAVLNMLRITQTNFLVWMCRFPKDSLQSAVDGWLCVRRAARMAAQTCGHPPWTYIHAKAFMDYWGHAARLPHPEVRHVTKVLKVRGTSWQIVNMNRVRRARGYWPDCSRLIQLSWTQYRGRWHPLAWEEAARDRALWRKFTAWYLETNSIPQTFYPTLEEVDLRGRALSKMGTEYYLLPMRHPPVDTPYTTAYFEYPPLSPEDTEQSIRVSTDGSCMRGLGGAAAVLLPPYGDVENDVVILQQAVPGRSTNIRAEIVAACKILEAIKRIKQHVKIGTFLFMTDSQHVLQLLQGACRSVAHAPDVSCLMLLWQEVAGYTTFRHVKSHNGDPLNELADQCAKEAVHFDHAGLVIRRRDYSRSYFEMAPGTSPLWLW